jgi:three-Cys-motif partner protein
VPNPNEPVWPADPHTLAKHEILRRYFSRWLPMLAKYHARIVYVDGFAGPGRYQGGEPGSPILILQRVLDYLKQGTLRANQLTAIFAEADKKRYKHLKAEIATLAQAEPLLRGISLHTFEGEYSTIMDQIWSVLEQSKTRLAPTFVFIDPFGISGMPYDHLMQLFSHSRTECLITVMYEEINRFKNRPEFEKHLNIFFGDTAWQNMRSIASSQERKQFFIEYARARLVAAGAKYVLVFEMRNAQGALDYMLFFATQRIEGVKVMKEAMWAVDKAGGFTFSDYTYAAGPMLIKPLVDYRQLQKQIVERFELRTVDIKEVDEYVLSQTSYLSYRREGLKPLEGSKLRAIPPEGKKHRLGAYPPGTRIEFLKSL